MRVVVGSPDVLFRLLEVIEGYAATVLPPPADRTEIEPDVFLLDDTCDLELFAGPLPEMILQPSEESSIVELLDRRVAARTQRDHVLVVATPVVSTRN